MRSKPSSSATGDRAVVPTKTFPAAPGHGSSSCRPASRDLHGLPDCLFMSLAELCVNDPRIAVRIVDDRTSPLIWGEARSLRCLFLQMCIRDRYTRCRELWPKLNEYEHREFLAIYRLGEPPSPNFFLDIMVNEEQTWHDLGDSVSSSGSIAYDLAISSSGSTVSSARTQVTI